MVLDGCFLKERAETLSIERTWWRDDGMENSTLCSQRSCLGICDGNRALIVLKSVVYETV